MKPPIFNCCNLNRIAPGQTESNAFLMSNATNSTCRELEIELEITSSSSNNEFNVRLFLLNPYWATSKDFSVSIININRALTILSNNFTIVLIRLIGLTSFAVDMLLSQGMNSIN